MICIISICSKYYNTYIFYVIVIISTIFYKGLRLSYEEIINLILIEIERHLKRNRKSLKDFSGLPSPKGHVVEYLGNKLIYEERNYHPAKKLQEFIDEQRYVFKQIMEAVNNKKRRCVFLYGYGRTWKTYILRTLASYIRSKKQFCLTDASSRIASLLLLGGRTTHSKFKIPISTLEYSTCRIDK